jgi:hypothetical protein
MNHLPQTPENNIRGISHFFKSSWRYSQVKEHHRTGGNLPSVSMTPVENLPLVSAKLVENNENNISLLTPYREIEEKINLYVKLYYPKVSKQNI